MKKLCPVFRSACEEDGCEFWSVSYNMCDLHRAVKKFIEEM